MNDFLQKRNELLFEFKEIIDLETEVKKLSDRNTLLTLQINSNERSLKESENYVTNDFFDINSKKNDVMDITLPDIDKENIDTTIKDFFDNYENLKKQYKSTSNRIAVDLYVDEFVSDLYDVDKSSTLSNDNTNLLYELNKKKMEYKREKMNILKDLEGLYKDIDILICIQDNFEDYLNKLNMMSSVLVENRMWNIQTHHKQEMKLENIQIITI